jgi:ribosome recycling factor
MLPRPTVEARLNAYSNASKLAEDARVQIRRQHQASLKKGKYSRHSTEYHEVSTLEVFFVSERTEYEFSLQVPKTARSSHC